MFTDGGSVRYLLEYIFNMYWSFPPFGILISIRDRVRRYGGKVLGQPFFLPPQALLHGICNVLKAVQHIRGYIHGNYDKDHRWNIASMLATVDDSSTPVMMPAAMSVFNPRSSQTGWLLILDAPSKNSEKRICYAFVYHSGADSNWEVVGLDGFLSSPNFATIKEDRLVIVSEMGSMFDGMDLLSENEVNAILTSDVEHHIVD